MKTKLYILILLLFPIFGFSQYQWFGAVEHGNSDTLLLDVYPNAASAYSLRLLSSNYTGDCIKVRRDSDDTTQDIGFVDGVLDTTSLLTFVGSGDGFVDTWYDQGDLGLNQIQADEAKQPRIVNGGVVEKYSGKPAIWSDANFGFISTGDKTDYNFAHTTEASVLSVYSFPTETSGVVAGTNGSGTSGTRAGFQTFIGYTWSLSIYNPSTTTLVLQDAGSDSNVGIVFYGWDVREAVAADRSDIWYNEVKNTTPNTETGVVGTSNADKALSVLGRFGTGSGAPTGHLSEYVIWSVRNADNAISIQESVNAFYSIY